MRRSGPTGRTGGVGLALLLCAHAGCGGLEYYNPTAPTGDKDGVTDPLGDDDDATGPGTDTEPPTTPTDPTTPPTTSTTGGHTTTVGTPTTTSGTTTGGTTTGGTTTGGTTTGGTTTGGTTTGGTTTYTPPPPPPPIALTSISPDYGSTAGGTTVTATGTFDATTSLAFDGVAATVVSQTATTLVVTTPAHGGDGWVDVAAIDGAQVAPLANAYQYWRDGTGQTGAIGWMSYVELVGGYWTNPMDTALGLAAFTAPASWELWKDYATVMDTCEFNHASQGFPTILDPGAGQLDLVSGAVGATLPLDPALTGVFDDVLVPNNDVVPGVLYDLDPVAGNADWPGFGVDGFVEMPVSFTVTNPNLDRNNAPDVLREFTIDWDGGGGDYVLIYILRQYQTLFGAWNNDGVVTCAVSDTGSFTILAGTWPDWYKDDFLHIQVGRVIESGAVLPHNNATNRMAGIYWYYGGAYTIK